MDVKVVLRKSGWALVQYREADVSYRCWVPETMVVTTPDGRITVDDPSLGVPYGIRFDLLPDFHIKSVDLGEELHRRGIWTLEDMAANPNAVVASIVAVGGLQRSQLYQACVSLDNSGGSS